MCTISPLINLSLSSPLNKSVCLHHSGSQGLLLHLCTFWFVSWWLAPFLYLWAGWGFLFLISCVFWGNALGNSLCSSLFVIHLFLFFYVIILFQIIVNPCLYLRKYCVFFLFVFFLSNFNLMWSDMQGGSSESFMWVLKYFRTFFMCFFLFDLMTMKVCFMMEMIYSIFCIF